MHEEHGQADNAPDTSAGYERRDVQVSLILWAFLFIAILSTVAFISMNWLWGGFERMPSTSATGEVPSVAMEADTFVHPAVGPKLQDNPVRDLEELTAKQTAMVNGYGWVDKEQGIAHIPVDEAMKEIAENGLPVWEAPEDESSTDAAGETPAAQ